MNFDGYARQYDEGLRRGIRLSGEDADFFARGRLAAARAYFARVGIRPGRILEFGCGIGNHVGILREFWPGSDITGLDISEESLAVARERWRGDGIRFLTPEAFRAGAVAPVDWVFCAGVMHHIPPAARDDALGLVRDLLAERGVLTVFENNPFNPGARLVMRRIPFDRGAVMVNPYRLRSKLRALGFEEVSCRFLFVFPRPLAFLRGLEPRLEPLPLGAQYGVFARWKGANASRSRRG